MLQPGNPSFIAAPCIGNQPAVAQVEGPQGTTSREVRQSDSSRAANHRLLSLAVVPGAALDDGLEIATTDFHLTLSWPHVQLAE
jgi:hypothetical protein